MITLYTKNGSRTSNAIIYGGNPEITSRSGTPENTFLVETDFGNRMELTWKEIDEMFTIGRVRSFEEWKADRERKRSEPY